MSQFEDFPLKTFSCSYVAIRRFPSENLLVLLCRNSKIFLMNIFSCSFVASKRFFPGCGPGAVFLSVILKKLPCPEMPRKGGWATPSGVGQTRNEM